MAATQILGSANEKAMMSQPQCCTKLGCRGCANFTTLMPCRSKKLANLSFNISRSAIRLCILSIYLIKQPGRSSAPATSAKCLSGLIRNAGTDSRTRFAVSTSQTGINLRDQMVSLRKWKRGMNSRLRKYNWVEDSLRKFLVA